MIGIAGAIGREMCLSLTNFNRDDVSSLKILAYTSTGKTCQYDSSETELILMSISHTIASNQSSGHALAIDGRIFSPRFNGLEHADEVQKAIEKQGLMSLANQEGFYSLAYLDVAQQQIHILRDQWGAQTLYYLADERGTAFSSNLTSLIPLLGNDIRANLTAAERFLRTGVSPQENETYFDGIHQVPTRTLLSIPFDSNAEPLVSDFHQPLRVRDEDLEVPYEEAVHSARELFRQSVENCMRHSALPGFTLSGGVDSSAAIMMARSIYPQQDLNTYSYVTNARKSIDEERFVDVVNESAGAIEHKLRMDAGDFFQYLPEAIKSRGTPLNGTSQVAQYLLYKMASGDGVDTMINGVEADSTFGGHFYFLVDRFQELVERGSILNAVGFAWSILTTSTRSQLQTIALAVVGRLPRRLSAMLSGILRPHTQRSWLGFTSHHSSTPINNARGRRIRRRLQTHMQYQLSHDQHLRHAELSGASFGIRSYTPFLHRELNEYILSLPSKYLISDQGETKTFLRAVVDGVIPDQVLNRRDKIGFEPPTREWFNQEAELIEAYLADGVRMGILSSDHNLLETKRWSTIARTISYIEWARSFSVRMSL